MMFYAVLHIIMYWLTKYLLTPLHKDAVIGGLKRFDHFGRVSLRKWLSVDSLIQYHCMTIDIIIVSIIIVVY